MSSRQGSVVCTSLTKMFGNRTVVDGLSFEVPTGSVTGFVGPT